MHQVVNLPYGAVLLKNFLTREQQTALINDIANTHNKTGNNIGECSYAPNALFTYNAGTRMPYVISAEKSPQITNILNFGEAIANVINDLKKTDCYKSSIYKFKISDHDRMQADSIYCVSYNDAGHCYRHTDLWGSWVVGASFGLSCDFRYGLNKTRADNFIRVDESNYDDFTSFKSLKKIKLMNTDIVIKIMNGDILVFNGNLLYHEVTKIYDDPPEFWNTIPNIDKRIKRINLQFRDSRTIDENINHTSNNELNMHNMANMNLML